VRCALALEHGEAGALHRCAVSLDEDVLPAWPPVSLLVSYSGLASYLGLDRLSRRPTVLHCLADTGGCHLVPSRLRLPRLARLFCCCRLQDRSYSCKCLRARRAEMDRARWRCMSSGPLRCRHGRALGCRANEHDSFRLQPTQQRANRLDGSYYQNRIRHAGYFAAAHG
jgi:hypothetical protein